MPLGRSWGDLGASWGELRPSGGDLRASLGDLGAILARLGVNLDRLGTTWVHLGGQSLEGGGGVSRRAWPPQRLSSKVSSRSSRIQRDVHNGALPSGLTTRRASLGAADLERPAGETPPPPSRDLPRAAFALVSVHLRLNTVVSWGCSAIRFVRELLGFPGRCRRFFVGCVGRTSTLLERS